jgi:hypothetical protein
MDKNTLSGSCDMVEEMLMMCRGKALDALMEILSDGMEAGQGDYSDRVWDQACNVIENLKDAIRAHAEDIGYDL